MDEARARCLSRVPDLPRWVETRDLLLWGGSRLLENSDRSGFVVWSAEDGLGAVVGYPERPALEEAAAEVPELLAFADNIDRVRLLLPEFEPEVATIFSAPETLPRAQPHPSREMTPSEITMQHHLSDELLAELCGVGEDGLPIVAAFDGSLPVAFAYVASETETLWDVSIDTIPSHRRQGYAGAAVLHLMRAMSKKGKSAVWGALASNVASASLARRLGFVENDRLWVLTRTRT